MEAINIDTSVPLFNLTVEQYEELLDSKMDKLIEKTVRIIEDRKAHVVVIGAASVAKEIGVSPATINRWKGEGRLEGMYEQVSGSRIIRYNLTKIQRWFAEGGPDVRKKKGRPGQRRRR